MNFFSKNLLFVIVLLSIGCKRTPRNLTKDGEALDTQVSIEILNYPVKVNEPIKALAKLHNSTLIKNNSQIIVALEEYENPPLKEDLSNEYEINMIFFENLAVDTFNQKWIKTDNAKYSAIFGKEFKTNGKHRLRGYVLDYYGTNFLDTILPEKSEKYYFDVEVQISKDKN